MLNSYGVSCKKDHEHLIIEKTMKTDDGAPTIKRYQQPVTNLTGVIAETGIYLSPGALTLLLQQTIPIIWMNKHELVGMAHGFAGSGTVITRRAQFKAFDDDRGIHLAKRFVIGGLYNKANLLLSYAKNRPDNGGENIKHEVLKIREIVQQVLSLKEENQLDKTRGILMALEAQGARIYHSELIKLIPEEYRFVKRTRRPPKDPINAALSYGYAILNARCLLAIIGTGIEQYGGYLHVDRY